MLELLLGAGIAIAGFVVPAVITRIGVRADARTKAKQEAVEQLAEWVRYAWDKSNDQGWIDLQVYLSRLRGPLHRAGVASNLYVDFRTKVEAMWHRIEWIPELEDGKGDWSADSDVLDPATGAADRIYRELEEQPARWRRALT